MSAGKDASSLDLTAAIIDELQELNLPSSDDDLNELADALTALQNSPPEEHWWHEQQQEGVILLRLFAHAGSCRHVDDLAARLLDPVGRCSQCVCAYHYAQAQLDEDDRGQTARQAAAELKRRDEVRVAAALRAAAASGSEIGPEAISVLFEVLSFQDLLDDAEVSAAAETALLALSREHDLALTEGGRYPGLYRLLAHSSSGLRSLVGSAVRALGPFESEEEVESISPVLQSWDATLAFDLFEVERVEQGRPRWQQPRQTLWLALNTVLGLMRPASMPLALQLMPRAPAAIADFACGGASVSWPALSCLKSIFQALRHEAWQSIQEDPETLVTRLGDVATKALDARLQAHVVGALRALGFSLPTGETHGKWAMLRRQLFWTLLHRVCGTQTLHPAAAEMAVRAAFDLAGQTLNPNPGPAADMHLFGPQLCRIMGQPESSRNPEIFASAVSACKALLEADAAALAAGNEGLGSSAANDRSQLVAPALWTGLAAAGGAEVSELLLGAAAGLAHVTGAAAGARPAATSGFYAAGTAILGRVEAASSWPQLHPNFPAQVNPHAIEVSEAPGLLLQAFRAAVVSHLGEGRLDTAAFKRAGESARVSVIESLVKLCVGVHSPLREAAEKCLRTMTGCSSRQEALAGLIWSPACATSIFQALAHSLILLASMSPLQALVRRDAPEVLQLVAEILQGSEGCGLDDSAERKQLIDAAWAFMSPALLKARQLASFRTAASAVQAMFDLLPIIWRESARPQLEASVLSHSERAALSHRLAFLAEALPWGSICEGQVAKSWMVSMHQILKGLSGSSEGCLPKEALDAAARVMAPDSKVPDEARLVLGPLLKQQAPGNLGGSILSALPSRSKVALPHLPSARAGIQQPGKPAPEASSTIIDLTNDEPLRPQPSRRAGGSRSILEWTAPASLLNRAGAAGAAAPARSGSPRPGMSHSSLQARPGSSIDWQLNSSAAEASKRPPISVTGAGPSRLGSSGQKKAGEVDLDQIWADAKRAADEASSWRGQGASKGKPKPGGHSKLKALMDKADSEHKEANRKLPRSERQNLPARLPSVERGVNSDGRRKAEKRRQSTPPLPELDTKEKRARLGLPAVPKPARKAIQLDGAPGGSAPLTAAAARRTAAAAGQQAVLSLEEVQRDVLAWDYYEIIGGGRGKGRLEPVPTHFLSLAKYCHVFRALLLEELRAHILQAHTERPPDRAASKSKSGTARPSEYPVSVHSVQRRSLLHRVELHLDASLRADCRGEDLLLLHRESGGGEDDSAVHLLALVERVEAGGKPHGFQQLVTAHVNLLPGNQGAADSRLARASETLLPGVEWRATRLLSWTPHYRQLLALCRIHLLPAELRGRLLRPQPPPASLPTSLPAAVPRRLETALRAEHNASQMTAIAAAVSSKNQLTLVQGPPGTGKSATVISIISVLLGQAAPNPDPNPGSNPPVRVLVCAQSNAAVDELILRLAHPGILDQSGNRRVPAMLRFGSVEAAHPRVKPYHIDELADKLAASKPQLAAAQGNADKAKAAVAELQRQVKAAAEDAPGGAQTTTEPGEKRKLVAQLKAARAKAEAGGLAVTSERKAVRRAALETAEIVASTLSSAGGELLSLSRGRRGFQALVMDEAAQALEPAAHIALQLLADGGRVVLVGDPKQLPATVLSRAGEAANLTQSLFERLQRAGWPVVMLSQQFRMHPAISEWPSRFFYDGLLTDAVTADDRAAGFHVSRHFPPLALFDCREGREHSGGSGGSLANASEAEFVCALLKGLEAHFPGSLASSVAVLTPYKAQTGLLKAKLAATLGSQAMNAIEIATVDGFQGKEADVIVFSCVRARAPGAGSGVGFLADVRRMNVALTRARQALWIVGHTETLKNSPPWAALLSHVTSRGSLFTVAPPYHQIFSRAAGPRASNRVEQQAHRQPGKKMRSRDKAQAGPSKRAAVALKPKPSESGRQRTANPTAAGQSSKQEMKTAENPGGTLSIEFLEEIESE